MIRISPRPGEARNPDFARSCPRQRARRIVVSGVCFLQQKVPIRHRQAPVSVAYLQHCGRILHRPREVGQGLLRKRSIEGLIRTAIPEAPGARRARARRREHLDLAGSRADNRASGSSSSSPDARGVGTATSARLAPGRTSRRGRRRLPPAPRAGPRRPRGAQLLRPSLPPAGRFGAGARAPAPCRHAAAGGGHPSPAPRARAGARRCAGTGAARLPGGGPPGTTGHRPAIQPGCRAAQALASRGGGRMFPPRARYRPRGCRGGAQPRPHAGGAAPLGRSLRGLYAGARAPSRLGGGPERAGRGITPSGTAPRGARRLSPRPRARAGRRTAPQQPGGGTERAGPAP